MIGCIRTMHAVWHDPTQARAHLRFVAQARAHSRAQEQTTGSSKPLASASANQYAQAHACARTGNLAPRRAWRVEWPVPEKDVPAKRHAHGRRSSDSLLNIELATI